MPVAFAPAPSPERHDPLGNNRVLELGLYALHGEPTLNLGQATVPAPTSNANWYADPGVFARREDVPRAEQATPRPDADRAWLDAMWEAHDKKWANRPTAVTFDTPPHQNLLLGPGKPLEESDRETVQAAREAGRTIKRHSRRAPSSIGRLLGRT